MLGIIAIRILSTIFAVNLDKIKISYEMSNKKN